MEQALPTTVSHPPSRGTCSKTCDIPTPKSFAKYDNTFWRIWQFFYLHIHWMSKMSTPNIQEIKIWEKVKTEKTYIDKLS
jgi:hypothetical protein